MSARDRLRDLSAKIARLEEESVNARRVAQDVSGDEEHSMAAQARALTIAGELDMTMREFVRVWDEHDADERRTT